MSKLTDQASAAFAEVQRKVMELQDAVIALQGVYDPNTVGLQEWCHHMDEVLYEISAEMYSEVE